MIVYLPIHGMENVEELIRKKSQKGEKLKCDIKCRKRENVSMEE